MRASETRALRAIRSRATLIARAAPRRAANAGQVRLIASESDCRARTDWMENKKPGSVGSPQAGWSRQAGGSRSLGRWRHPRGTHRGKEKLKL
jgi:hypothetical protein